MEAPVNRLRDSVLLEKSIFTFLIISTFLVWLVAMPLDVLEVDAAQYASISAEMAKTHHYLIPLHRGEPYYLDKPPLLFWLSAISFQLFGFSNIAYRLPSTITAAGIIYAVWHISKKYYPSKIARLATLFTATTQGFFLMIEDVRTDTLLLAGIMLAVWQSITYFEKKSITALFGIGFGIGIGMLAKGPLGLLVPGVIVLTHLIYQGQLKKVLALEFWFVVSAVVLLMLLPMLIGLYQQYSTEGLYFFFWKQSFGRITGESEWNNSTGFDFFFHTSLWVLFPWSITAILGAVQWIRNYSKGKYSNEIIGLSGWLIPLVVLSLSRFKLPHYIYITIPFASITAASFFQESATELKFNAIIQDILNVLGIIGLITLITWPFGIAKVISWLGVICFLGIGLYVRFWLAIDLLKNWWASAFVMLALNWIIFTHMLPHLCLFQSGAQLGHFLRKSSSISTERLFSFKVPALHTLDFYSGKTIKFTDNIDTLISKTIEIPVYIFTNEAGLKELAYNNFKIKILQTFDHFHVANPNLLFLNPNTRHQVIEKRFLLQISHPSLNRQPMAGIDSKYFKNLANFAA